MTPIRIFFATAASAAALAAPAGAAPVDVFFSPPQIEADPGLCAPRPPMHVLAERWGEYDGGPLGDRTLRQIRRDLRLLRQNDAERWFDTISAAQERMVEVFESYDGVDRVLDRVDLLIAADRLGTLREENLIEDVIEAGESGSNSAIVKAADMFLEGQGVAQDEERAISLYRRAAYAGHPSALLKMAELSAERDIAEWNIEPEVAITMALGALLGDLDPFICDRVNRIASLYEDGDLISQNPDLAEDWYRFGASLGGVTAAWNVAQMHYEATQIEKDNDVMMSHMRQAAEGDLTYAMLQLGDILERGALAERDVEEARRLYAEAADYGSRTAMIRLVGLAREAADDSPEARARSADALDRILNADNPPSWAYLQRGDLILAEDGRWAGAEKALELYRTALDLDPDNTAARLRLAELNLDDVASDQALLDTASGLRNAVRATGRATPMEDLQSLFNCRAPSAPYPEQADYWARMESFSGDMSAGLAPTEIAQLDADSDPITLARMQSQAINLRAGSLVELALASQETDLAPLRRMADDAGVRIHLAKAKLDYARGDMAAAESAARDAVEAEEPGAEDYLLRILFHQFKDGETGLRDEIVERARDRAAQGNGNAISTLIEIGEATTSEAWRQYEEAIERNGDVDAMMFALPRVERDRIPVLRRRIRSIIECNTNSALAYADALRRAGKVEAAAEWIDIAEGLADGAGWEHVAIADALRETMPGTPDRAIALYREAAEAGYSVAMRRLLSMRQDGELEMSAEDTADMFAKLLDTVPTDDVPVVLQFLTYSDPDVQNLVEQRIDRRALYAEAAEEGNAVAQLELAKIVRDSGAEGDTTKRYAELLQRSAEGGNADAMFLLSQVYAYGVGVEASPETSRAWLHAAARAGNETAAATADLLE